MRHIFLWFMGYINTFELSWTNIMKTSKSLLKKFLVDSQTFRLHPLSFYVVFPVPCSHHPPVSPPEQGVLAVWGQVGLDATHRPQAAETGGRHQATVVRLVLVSDALCSVPRMHSWTSLKTLAVICRLNIFLVGSRYDKELEHFRRSFVLDSVFTQMCCSLKKDTSVFPSCVSASNKHKINSWV